MSTVRQHLAAFHKAAAAHHEAMYGHFSAMSECMTKAESDPAMKTMGGHYAKVAAEHKSHAAFHSQQCSACEKSIETDLEKVVPLPTGFSIALPDNPSATLTAVPRHGQPKIDASGRPNVPMEFAKLASIEDDGDED